MDILYFVKHHGHLLLKCKLLYALAEAAHRSLVNDLNFLCSQICEQTLLPINDLIDGCEVFARILLLHEGELACFEPLLDLL